MKKRIFISSMLCLALIGGSINVLQAQETKQEQQQPEKKKSKLGSFVRKVGEATTGINMSNEPFAVIPFDAQKLISMEVVSCTGYSKTGQVLLTLAVKAKQEGVKTNLGKSCGNGNQECITAYDTSGATFEGQETGTFTQVVAQKECPLNIPVQYSFGFTGVPATLAGLEMARIEFYIAAKSGNVGSNMSKIEPIQVRNIPITWE